MYPFLPNCTSLTNHPTIFSPVHSSIAGTILLVVDIRSCRNAEVLTASAHRKFWASFVKLACVISTIALCHMTAILLSTLPFCWGVYGAVYSNVIPLGLQKSCSVV